MTKAAKLSLAGAAVGIAAIAGVYLHTTQFQSHLDEVIVDDTRNGFISARVRLSNPFDASGIVFDVREVSAGASRVDIVRVLLQFAAKVKDHRFERVYLAYQGERRFQLDGEYFHTLGNEYGSQNPMFTLRTLPENVRDLKGENVYGSWTGGILGVLGKQMDDLNEFVDRWCETGAVAER